MMEDSEASEYGELKNARLTVTTRADGENNVAQGSIYIFNQEGKCIQLLSTDEVSNAVSVQLEPGNYSLYAVGGNDLTRFSMPKQNEATTTSVITRLEGKVMDDLLMKKADISLEDGEAISQTISLEHKVICLSHLEIKQVPDNVTKVEVAISPLYSSIRLDGTYPETPTESYKIALTKQVDGKTWAATPQQMLFPSKGTPTIKVTVATATEVQAYSYTASEELPENHHFTIIGTYKVSHGVSLTGILTAAEWGEDRTISFDIDNKYLVYPEPGQFYNGYYVVTADKTAKTAVLLAKESVNYTVPGENAEAEEWQQSITSAMSTLTLPEGVIGSWRLPTLQEVSIFTKDARIVSFDSEGCSQVFFCSNNGSFGWGYSVKDGNEYTLKKGKTPLKSFMLLQPVIDINY